jgi:hypothetical protein
LEYEVDNKFMAPWEFSCIPNSKKQCAVSMRFFKAFAARGRMDTAHSILGTSKNPILGRIAALIVQCDPRNTDVLLRFALARHSD